ncbi:acetylornithine transaminase [Desulfovibrio sp. TomC]|uniref:acetylornithine transaminase n=1 Tax=Desulfovibrio sp. TomC TaxID=1562888 RepID=UPI0005BC6A17|nr:acetylornithine transaminase [Desulfovibrio sp. TomC]
MHQSPVDSSALLEITVRPDVVFVSGQGSWLTDSQGKVYLDFIQGWAVNSLGHAPAVLARAIAEQAQRLITPSPAYYSDKLLEFAGRLVAATPVDKVFFTNSGAEAVEGAVKLARKWGQVHKNGAYEIITFRNAFHGRTLTCMAASGKAGWDALFEPKTPGFPKAVYNDLESVARLVTDRTVAVMLEPVQGEGGVIPADDDFLRELRRFTQERGLLLILDEVQSGMGRTGKLFGHQHAGIVPDILTMGKGIGGGFPLAAMGCRAEVSCFAPGEQGGTYNGNALACAAGLAVLETLLAPGFLDAVEAAGTYLRERLDPVAQGLGYGRVRGRGLLLALALGCDRAAAVVEGCRERGLLVNNTRPDAIRLTPALTVSQTEIDQCVAILGEALAAAAG